MDNAFPGSWGYAVVLAFLKKNKPPIEAGSNRSIALTSCLCKLLERVVSYRLQDYLEKNEIVSERQFRF